MEREEAKKLVREVSNDRDDDPAADAFAQEWAWQYARPIDSGARESEIASAFRAGKLHGART